MHLSRPIAAAFLLMFALIGQTHAANYYVRTSGDDDNIGTTSGAAFATIDRAAFSAGNGDIVWVGGGVYTDPIYVLGKKPASSVRFIADINGIHTGDAGSVLVYGTPFRVAGSNSVEIKDFTFQGMAAYPVIWQNSYDGLVEGCTFIGGAKAVLVKDGSVILDDCQLDDFQYDAIQVDGSARLTIRNCDISDSLRHAVLVRKDAVTLIENSTISGSTGDGVHVNVTGDTIVLDSIPVPNCDCEGTSPIDLRQQAHDILSNLTLADPVYNQILDSATTKLGNSMSGSLWSDDWHVAISTSSTMFNNTSEAVEEVFAVLSEDVDFIIQNGQIVVSHPFIADVQVIGAAITSGSNHVPVTVQVKVGTTEYDPWGPFTSPTQADVNDANNPRTFESPDTFDPTEVITVAGRSWLKVNATYSGDLDSHWYTYMSVDSDSNSPYVLVLRDGDPIPNIAGYNGQASAETFLQPYIDAATDTITLDNNQAIFLFELGTTDLTSAAADFQDLVVVMTMARPVTPLTQYEKDQLTAALDLIMQSTEQLANCAIDEATVGGGTAPELQTAEDNYNTGVSEAAAAQYSDAATAWQAAWVAAKAATGNVEPDLDGIMAQLMSAAPPAGWIAISAGDVDFDTCQVTGNENGVYLETSLNFETNDSDFSSNRTWGLNLRGTCTLSQITLDANQYGGVMLSQMADADLTATNVTATNNTDYAVFFEDCTLTVDAADFANWSISGSKYVLAGQGGSLTLDGVSISGGSSAGVYFYQGDLTVQNAALTSNGYGVAADESTLTVTQSSLSLNTVGIYTNNTATMTVSDTDIFNNSTAGVTIHSPDAAATLTSCQIYNNDSGISLSDASTGDLILVLTVVRDNTQHGLYFENCNLSLADQSTNNWQSLRNGSGITANGGTLTLNGVEVEDSVNFGIYCTNSSVTLTNCDLIGSSGAYLASDNLSFTAGSTSFVGSSATGSWGLTQLGGTATLKNCLVRGFESGLQLDNGVSSIINATLVGNSNYGVHVNGANATLQNTIIAGSSGQNAIARTSGQLTHTYNLVHGFATPFAGTTVHDTEFVKKPRFVDTANNDYHLAVGSPAINSGADVGGQVPTDKDGNTRPSHGAFEIGAFEYVNSQGSFRVLDWKEQE